MSIWTVMFWFYFVIASVLTLAWLWKTSTDKGPKVFEDKPCQCLHPIKCDLFDKCMRGQK